MRDEDAPRGRRRRAGRRSSVSKSPWTPNSSAFVRSRIDAGAEQRQHVADRRRSRGSMTTPAMTPGIDEQGDDPGGRVRPARRVRRDGHRQAAEEAGDHEAACGEDRRQRRQVVAERADDVGGEQDPAEEQHELGQQEQDEQRQPRSRGSGRARSRSGGGRGRSTAARTPWRWSRPNSSGACAAQNRPMIAAIVRPRIRVVADRRVRAVELARPAAEPGGERRARRGSMTAGRIAKTSRGRTGRSSPGRLRPMP